MNILAWILFLLFAAILCLMISILFYKPKQTVAVSLNRPDEKKAEDEEQTQINYEKAGKMQINDLMVRWPEIKICMEIHPLDHALLLHWKGNTASRQTILFSFTNDICRKAFFEAVRRIYDNGEQPLYNFYVAIPYTSQLEKECSDECQLYLNHLGIRITGVLMDGSDNENLLGQARCQALIGTSMGAYGEYKVNGNTRKLQAWMDHLQPSDLIPLTCNEHLWKIVMALKVQIPWMIRMELKIAPEKGIHDLLQYIPDAWTWMRASVEKKNDILIVRAPDHIMMDTAVQVLEERASRESLYFTEVRKLSESESVSEGEWIYTSLENAIEGTLNVRGIVPVPMADTGSSGRYDGCHTCWYMPLNEKKKESSETTILFYHVILTKV